LRYLKHFDSSLERVENAIYMDANLVTWPIAIRYPKNERQ